jgi:hypothetical protein
MPPCTEFTVKDSYQYLDGLGNYHQCVLLGVLSGGLDQQSIQI